MHLVKYGVECLLLHAGLERHVQVLVSSHVEETPNDVAIREPIAVGFGKVNTSPQNNFERRNNILALHTFGSVL